MRCLLDKKRCEEEPYDNPPLSLTKQVIGKPWIPPSPLDPPDPRLCRYMNVVRKEDTWIQDAVDYIWKMDTKRCYVVNDCDLSGYNGEYGLLIFLPEELDMHMMLWICALRNAWPTAPGFEMLRKNYFKIFLYTHTDSLSNICHKNKKYQNKVMSLLLDGFPYVDDEFVKEDR